MSPDKLVTHEDLLTLRGVRARTSVNDGESLRLLDRLITAAEADRPPLPEGWVAIEPHEVREGDIVSVYYEGRDDVEGHRYTGRVGVDEDGGAFFIHDAERDFLAVYLTLLSKAPEGVRDFRRLTPLRPTVTEADIERAASEIERLAIDLNYTDLTHAAFKAAGIEVRDDS